MRLRTISIAALIVVANVTNVRADLLLGAQIGGGPLRLDDLEDFWDDFGIHHDTDPLAFNWELSGTWRFAARHAVRLAAGRITTSVDLFIVSAFDPPFSMGFWTSEQNFTAIPISLSYEFSIWATTPGAVTMAGVGGDYYMAEIEGLEVSYHDDPLLAGAYHGSREGNGYGFHGYLRQTALIAENLSLSGMLRGRWADSMAFDDSDGDFPVEFMSLDLSLGIEWRI